MMKSSRKKYKKVPNDMLGWTTTTSKHTRSKHGKVHSRRKSSKVKRQTRAAESRRLNSIQWFTDRDNNRITDSLIYEPVTTPWSSDWKDFEAPQSVINDMNKQLDERMGTRNGKDSKKSCEWKVRSKLRKEPYSLRQMREKLQKGLMGEIFLWTHLKQYQYKEEDVGTPRNDGPSTCGDLFAFDGTVSEVKTTEGEYIKGDYRRLKDLSHKEKQKIYVKNSPSYMVNVADKNGNVTRGHINKAHVGSSYENEFLVGVRHRIHNGNHQHKVSFIIRMIDFNHLVISEDGNHHRLWHDIAQPWDDKRKKYKDMCKSKRRIIEELIYENWERFHLNFYRPIDNRGNPNIKKEEVTMEEISPKGVSEVFDVPKKPNKAKLGKYDIDTSDLHITFGEDEMVNPLEGEDRLWGDMSSDED